MDSSWMALNTSPIIHDLIPADGLEDGHVVVPLVGADQPADVHPGAELLEEVLVDVVDPGTELVDPHAVFLVTGVLLADEEALDERPEVRRDELLLRVGQGGGRVAVRLDHEALEAQVHRPLGQLLQVLPVSAHVGRVGEDGEVRIAGAQFDGDLPARRIAVGLAVDRGEAAVDDAEFPDAGAVQALQGADPQVQVRIDGILHQDGDIRILEGVGDFLHEEGVGSRAGADPEQVDTVLEALVHMLLVRNLGAHKHPGLFLHLFQPFQTGRAHTFEAARVRAGFPDARPEHVDAPGRETAGRFQDLLFGFRTARARNHHRAREREESPFADGDDIECLCHIIG